MYEKPTINRKSIFEIPKKSITETKNPIQNNLNDLMLIFSKIIFCVFYLKVLHCCINIKILNLQYSHNNIKAILIKMNLSE